MVLALDPNSMDLPEQVRARVALSRRSPEQAALLASNLAEEGFRVVQQTGTGAYIEGEPALYSRVFRAEVAMTPEGPRFVSEPQVPWRGDDEIDATVYFPTQPTLFSGR